MERIPLPLTQINAFNLVTNQNNVIITKEETFQHRRFFFYVKFLLRWAGCNKKNIQRQSPIEMESASNTECILVKIVKITNFKQKQTNKSNQI